MENETYAFVLNLQLFAEGDTGATVYDASSVGLTTAKPTSMSHEMKTYYNRELLENANPNLIYIQFGKRCPIPAGSGKLAEWRKFAQFERVKEPLTEGVVPKPSATSVSIITAETAQYGDWTPISDVLDLTAIDNVVLEVTKEHGDNAGRSLDSLVRDVVYANSNVMSDGSQKITPALIAQAVAALKRQNVPTINSKYHCIIHPSVAYDLMQDSAWLDAHKYANPENIYAGEIGELYGVRFFETTQAPIHSEKVGDATVASNVYYTPIFGLDAYGVVDVTGGGLETIVKDKSEGGTANPLNQFSTVGWKVTAFGAKMLYPERLVNLKVTSSLAASDNANV